MGGLLTRRHAAAGAAMGLLLAGGALVGAPAVGAGQQMQPTASADTECGDEGGMILVEIVDNSSETYDVYIDDVPVDEDVTDSDGGVYEYGPYDDGVHSVRVFWDGAEEDILDEDLTVDCAPEETTSTTTPTTAAPTPTTAAPTPTTEPPSAAPVVVAPTYTG